LCFYQSAILAFLQHKYNNGNIYDVRHSDWLATTGGLQRFVIEPPAGAGQEPQGEPLADKRPLVTREGMAQSTPTPGMLAAGTKRGAASSSFPSAAGRRSIDRLQGSISKLCGNGSNAKEWIGHYHYYI